MVRAALGAVASNSVGGQPTRCHNTRNARPEPGHRVPPPQRYRAAQRGLTAGGERGDGDVTSDPGRQLAQQRGGVGPIPLRCPIARAVQHSTQARASGEWH